MEEISMIARCFASLLLTALLAVAAVAEDKSPQAQTAPAASATAKAGGLTRDEIKAMPLLERPNRLGHFYGNTARRINERRGGRS
jgi:hypothetical protein